GRGDVAPAAEPARLGCDLPANDERADYLRATLAPAPDGVLIATPAPVQDSSMLMLLARADCLLVREPHAPRAKAGARCSIISLARWRQCPRRGQRVVAWAAAMSRRCG